jgi:NitT/TauT family transport system ATP-binding protein|tara:strand:+ start:1068 stop:1874 length:807 start_codon:yes stop_codon:yes gene_type:complete
MSETSAMKSKAGEMQMTDVCKSFGDKKIFENISFTIKKGSFTCICGPSGCGKTTLMDILAGYLQPDSGQCTFNGVPVSEPSPDRLVVFQENTLFQWMTLWDNTLFGPKILGKDLEEAAEKARELINLSGLNGFEKKYPRQLSGGMQRRAELIRVLINEPQILLMDEPFRGLDAMTRVMMQEYFLDVFETTQITMLLISSELDEAIFMGDSVYLLSAMPTTIKKKMLVNLPRPRVLEHQASKEFAEILTEAFETMESEALKVFELIPSG